MIFFTIMVSVVFIYVLLKNNKKLRQERDAASKILEINRIATEEKQKFNDVISCRKHIENCLNSMALSFSEKNREYGDVWDILLADFSIVVAAIRMRPEHIPTIVVGLTYALDVIKDIADQYKDIRFINMGEQLATITYSASSSLIDMHGYKITDVEGKEAMDFIESIKWDPESKKFIQTV